MRTFLGKAGLILLLTGLFAGCREQVAEKKAEPSKLGPIVPKAMVVSAHPLASEVGVAILQKGGTALDAAIAVQFALAVVHPSAGNIGGGGFMLVRAADGTVHSLDFREKAPAAAQRNMYLDSAGGVIGNLSWQGHQASGVPGVVEGMFAAHDSLGTLPMRDLIQPAIDLAEKGHLLTQKEAEGLNEQREDLLKYNTRPTAYTDSVVWEAGDRLFHPQLALTLSRVRDLGRNGFYEGATADSIVAEMKRGKGLITHKDLKNYRSAWREPIRGSYRGYEILSMGPPSSGGIALMQLLKMVEPFPLGIYGRHSTEAVHLMAEAERRVYADRAAHLGDPDFYPVPRSGLLDSAYIRQRMSDFQPGKATPSDSVAAGKPMPESDQTTHFSIVDAWGNAVSVTTTLNGGYGSSVVVGGAGFLLNNEMDDFSIKPGVPNAYGLVGAEANAIAPAKRMLSSMTPTIVTRNDSLFMVVGTPGGATIITSVFQNIVNVIDFGYGMQESVSATRFHSQWLPDKIFVEEGALDAAVSAQLEAMGHVLSPREPIGRVDAILRLPDGRLEGGADPRGDDFAAGY